MLTISVERLIELTGGELVCGEGSGMLNDVAVDSRDVGPGNLFVAFEGERVDGHTYLLEAMARGARGLLVTKSVDQMRPAIELAVQRGVAIVRVPDALAAVQRLAVHHRSRLFCPVIGVTGSTGKTTTKDFIRSVLGVSRRVVATSGNRNNELGVPLTVMEAGADTDVLVVEMAMRGIGQIRDLALIARPTAGLITNIGTSHIELLGTQDAIVQAKGELVASIDAEGVVFLNGDDAFSERLAALTEARVVLYGLAETSDPRAEDIETDSESMPSFDLVMSGTRRRITLRVPGRHNVYNALAAAAVANSLGMSIGQIQEGLEAAESGEMRMQTFLTAGGITVINDAYNANPTSMRAAIETLAGMTAADARVAVLGDMAELGSLAELAHFRIGERVAELPIDSLVTVGERAAHIADGARAAGMSASDIRPCATVEEASEVLDDLMAPGEAVLVKASRVMGLERVVEGLVNPRV